MRSFIIKGIIVIPILFLTIQQVKCQDKWKVGVYFIPSFLQYSFAKQNINLNLISGVQISRRISRKLFLNWGIFYFNNRLKGDSGTCYVCAPNTIKTYYRIRFIEIPFGVKFLLPKVEILKQSNVYAIFGFVLNNNFDSHEIDYDVYGNQNYYYKKRLMFHKVYSYLGISIHYKLTTTTTLFVDPLIRFSLATANFGYSLISYNSLIGVGVGININL